MELDRVILRLEKARRELLAVDPVNREKLLAASRKVDELILEYYRAKLGCQGKTEAVAMKGRQRLAPSWQQNFDRSFFSM